MCLRVGIDSRDTRRVIYVLALYPRLADGRTTDKKNAPARVSTKLLTATIASFQVVRMPVLRPLKARDQRSTDNSREYIRRVRHPPSHPPLLPLSRPTAPRLGYNDISPEGASALASLLHAGPGTLETLELGGNRIGDAGAAALAQGLAGKAYQRQGRMGQGGVGLLRLGLAGNGIGCVGGCALAKALGGRSRGGRVALRELELAGNAVSSYAVQYGIRY